MPDPDGDHPLDLQLCKIACVRTMVFMGPPTQGPEADTLLEAETPPPPTQTVHADGSRTNTESVIQWKWMPDGSGDLQLCKTLKTTATITPPHAVTFRMQLELAERLRQQGHEVAGGFWTQTNWAALGRTFASNDEPIGSNDEP